MIYLTHKKMEFNAEWLDCIGPQFPHREREVKPLGGLVGLYKVQKTVITLTSMISSRDWAYNVFHRNRATPTFMKERGNTEPRNKFTYEKGCGMNEEPGLAEARQELPLFLWAPVAACSALKIKWFNNDLKGKLSPHPEMFVTKCYENCQLLFGEVI